MTRIAVNKPSNVIKSIPKTFQGEKYYPEHESNPPTNKNNKRKKKRTQSLYWLAITTSATTIAIASLPVPTTQAQSVESEHGRTEMLKITQFHQKVFKKDNQQHFSVKTLLANQAAEKSVETIKMKGLLLSKLVLPESQISFNLYYQDLSEPQNHTEANRLQVLKFHVPFSSLKERSVDQKKRLSVVKTIRFGNDRRQNRTFFGYKMDPDFQLFLTDPTELQFEYFKGDFHIEKRRRLHHGLGNLPKKSGNQRTGRKRGFGEGVAGIEFSTDYVQFFYSNRTHVVSFELTRGENLAVVENHSNFLTKFLIFLAMFSIISTIAKLRIPLKTGNRRKSCQHLNQFFGFFLTSNIIKIGIYLRLIFLPFTSQLMMMTLYTTLAVMAVPDLRMLARLAKTQNLVKRAKGVLSSTKMALKLSISAIILLGYLLMIVQIPSLIFQFPVVRIILASLDIITLPEDQFKVKTAFQIFLGVFALNTCYMVIVYGLYYSVLLYTYGGVSFEFHWVANLAPCVVAYPLFALVCFFYQFNALEEVKWWRPVRRLKVDEELQICLDGSNISKWALSEQERYHRSPQPPEVSDELEESSVSQNGQNTNSRGEEGVTELIACIKPKYFTSPIWNEAISIVKGRSRTELNGVLLLAHSGARDNQSRLRYLYEIHKDLDARFYIIESVWIKDELRAEYIAFFYPHLNRIKLFNKKTRKIELRASQPKAFNRDEILGELTKNPRRKHLVIRKDGSFRLFITPKSEFHIYSFRHKNSALLNLTTKTGGPGADTGQKTVEVIDISHHRFKLSKSYKNKPKKESIQNQRAEVDMAFYKGFVAILDVQLYKTSQIGFLANKIKDQNIYICEVVKHTKIVRKEEEIENILQDAEIEEEGVSRGEIEEIRLTTESVEQRGHLLGILEGSFSSWRVEGFFFLSAKHIAVVMRDRMMVIDWRRAEVARVLKASEIFNYHFKTKIDREHYFASFYLSRRTKRVYANLGVFRSHKVASFYSSRFERDEREIEIHYKVRGYINLGRNKFLGLGPDSGCQVAASSLSSDTGHEEGLEPPVLNQDSQRSAARMESVNRPIFGVGRSRCVDVEAEKLFGNVYNF